MSDLVFLAEVRDELRQALSVCWRKKCMILIALPVVFDQVRKILLKEREKDGGRTGLQEKRIREDVIRACLSGRAYE